MMNILGRNAITTDRVRAIVTLFVTLAALLAMPTAGGFASAGDGAAIVAESCSAEAVQ